MILFLAQLNFNGRMTRNYKNTDFIRTLLVC